MQNKPKKQSHNQVFAIDSLHPNLVTYIASFLELNDIINLAKTNKKYQRLFENSSQPSKYNILYQGKKLTKKASFSQIMTTLQGVKKFKDLPNALYYCGTENPDPFVIARNINISLGITAIVILIGGITGTGVLAAVTHSVTKTFTAFGATIGTCTSLLFSGIGCNLFQPCVNRYHDKQKAQQDINDKKFAAFPVIGKTKKNPNDNNNQEKITNSQEANTYLIEHGITLFDKDGNFVVLDEKEIQRYKYLESDENEFSSEPKRFEMI